MLDVARFLSGLGCFVACWIDRVGCCYFWKYVRRARRVLLVDKFIGIRAQHGAVLRRACFLGGAGRTFRSPRCNRTHPCRGV